MATASYTTSRDTILRQGIEAFRAALDERFGPAAALLEPPVETLDAMLSGLRGAEILSRAVEPQGVVLRLRLLPVADRDGGSGREESLLFHQDKGGWHVVLGHAPDDGRTTRRLRELEGVIAGGSRETSTRHPRRPWWRCRSSGRPGRVGSHDQPIHRSAPAGARGSRRARAAADRLPETGATQDSGDRPCDFRHGNVGCPGLERPLLVFGSSAAHRLCPRTEPGDGRL